MSPATIRSDHQGVYVRYPDPGPWLARVSLLALPPSLCFWWMGRTSLSECLVWLSLPALTLVGALLLRCRRELQIGASRLVYTASPVLGRPRVDQAPLRDVRCFGVQMSCDRVPYVELLLPSGRRLAIPTGSVGEAISLAGAIRAQTSCPPPPLDLGSAEDIPPMPNRGRREPAKGR